MDGKILLMPCYRLDALQKARKWVTTINPSTWDSGSSRSLEVVEEPLYNVEELFGIVNPDIRMPLPMEEVLLRIVDGSKLEQYKPEYGKNLITAWAHIHGKRTRRYLYERVPDEDYQGHLVGVIANRTPVINMDESDKSTSFIHLCNQK